MDDLMASQIFCSAILFATAFSLSKRMWLWTFGGLLWMISPAWFAWVTGLWPFYSWSILHISGIIATLIFAKKGAEKNAKG